METLDPLSQIWRKAQDSGANSGAAPGDLLPGDGLHEGHLLPQKGRGTEHPPGASSVPGAHFHTLHLIGPQGWAEPPPCPGSGSCLEGHLAGVGQTCALWHPPGHLPLPMTMVKTESSVSSPVRSSVPHLCPFCLWWPSTWHLVLHCPCEGCPGETPLGRPNSQFPIPCSFNGAWQRLSAESLEGPSPSCHLTEGT